MSPRTEVASRGPATRTFGFRALHADGKIESAEATAASHAELGARLRREGMFPLEIVEIEREIVPARLGAEALARGFRVLASVFEAGLPMERALAVFADVAPTGWPRGMIDAMRDATREGRTLADAMAQSGLEVPGFILGIVRAGESHGALGQSLARAAEELEAAAATRSAIRGALAYPALLATVGGASILVLVGVVLPRFAVIVDSLGQHLPASARLLLAGVSVAKVGAVPLTLLALGLTVWWRRRLAVSPEIAIRWSERWLELPVIGPLRSGIEGARAAATLGALLATGVPIATAMQHTAGALGNAALRERLLRARDLVLSGERLSMAVSRSRALPASVVQLARAGEATGQLATMLTYAARMDRARTESEVKQLVRLVEPSLILLFGGAVALVAAALLQSVYAIRPTP